MDRHVFLTRATLLVVIALLLLPAAALDAQQAGRGAGQAEPLEPEDPRVVILNTESYLTPPPEVLEAVLATTIEDLRLGNLDPSGRLFVRTVGDGFPTLASFAKRRHNLGQFQIDPAANRNRRLTTRSDVGIELYTTEGTLATTIEIPEGARVSTPVWSPDGSQIGFFAHFDDATHIYVADTVSGQSTRITGTPVLATHVTTFEWTEDGEHIVTVLIPENRGPEPPAPEVPETPKVRVATPDRNGLRTYFDLLEDPYEKRLVHYYSTGQLARIEVASGDVEPIGAPAMIEGFDVAPDGDYLRVTTMKEELSYIVPVSNAGQKQEIWNTAGEALALLEEDDLNESVQTNGGGRGGGRGGRGDNSDDRRGLTWRPDGSPGMVYLQREPRPEGDAADDAAPDDPDAPATDEQESEEEQEPRADRVMIWRPPFGEADTEVLYETEDEIASMRFDDSGRLLFLTRREDDTETVHALSLDDPTQEYLIYEQDTEDRQNDQGSLMNGERGFTVRTSSDGRFVFLSGTQYFENPIEEAPRPFVDRVEILSGAKERIFQSDPDVFETVNTALDDDLTEVIVTRQSPTMVPNQWRVNLQTGAEQQVTFNEDHHPRITAARREMFTITRPDGFRSRVNVTLPPGHQDGTKLPAMFWFYPREFSEQEEYNERFETYNKNSFPGVGARSMDILTLLGYAVVEPDVPIVGPEGQRNDEYPHDLRNTLSAVIDELDARGWVDRRRLAIGGHSYGGFGTANAMIQTPFFKAGIAGDGNYNRSLTPAGFQSERRYLWEAQDLYIEMSPFFQADRLSGALLMYHGMDDHNVGTHPIHADRMFHALEVLGKTAAMYKYPYEDHGPATRETTLDLWARWVAWLDLYVMSPEADTETTDEDGSRGGR